jgi:hypothetical protein
MKVVEFIQKVNEALSIFNNKRVQDVAALNKRVQVVIAPLLPKGWVYNVEQVKIKDQNNRLDGVVLFKIEMEGRVTSLTIVPRYKYDENTTMEQYLSYINNRFINVEIEDLEDKAERLSAELKDIENRMRLLKEEATKPFQKIY